MTIIRLDSACEIGLGEAGLYIIMLTMVGGQGRGVGMPSVSMVIAHDRGGMLGVVTHLIT